jgi:hypothetical protein
MKNRQHNCLLKFNTTTTSICFGVICEVIFRPYLQLYKEEITNTMCFINRCFEISVFTIFILRVILVSRILK